MWRSGLCSTKRNGPVPTGSLIWFSPAASTISFGKIAAPLFGRASAARSTPDGCFMWITTVSGSFASTASTFFHIALPVPAIFPQRISEATTSAEVISLPVWNLTPLRRRIV